MLNGCCGGAWRTFRLLILCDASRRSSVQPDCQLTALETQALTADDPRLLDAIPRAAAWLATASPDIRETLYDALDIQVLYREDNQQMTIWVTITDSTPDTLQALLDDPRWRVQMRIRAGGARRGLAKVIAGAASIAAALRYHARRPSRPLRTIVKC